MTASRDPDRMIHAFLLEGEERLQDRVYDAVRAEVDLKRQRVVIGPWRLPTMNKLGPIGLGAAAAVAVLLLGSRLLIPSGSGGPGASPSPTTVASTPAPTTVAARSLPVGPFLVEDVGRPANSPFITVWIPASGWTSNPDDGGLKKGPEDGLPESGMLLWGWPTGTGFDVYQDPCHWKSTRPATPATTVEKIAAALAAQASRDAPAPLDVTIDGYAGKKVTLRVPNDAKFEQCDDAIFGTYGVAGSSTPNRLQQGPGQIDELWIVNVNSAVVIIDVMYRPDTPAALIDEMRSIAQSATFRW